MSARGFHVHKKGEPAFRLRPPATRALGAAVPPSGEGSLPEHRSSANERFKKSFWPTFGVALLPAVAVHYAVFAAFPSLATPSAEPSPAALAALEVPPRVSIPEPPAPVARPARPRIAVAVSERLTMAPTTFEAFEAREILSAPAPPPVVSDEGDRPKFVPFLVAPRLKNAEETRALLQRVYPRALKQAGIEGTVRLWIQIDDNGEVTDCQVDGTSGYPELDEAALTVARAMEFVPAVTPTDEPRVWIVLPIVFHVT